MSQLNKSQLKNALISHGVELPSSSAKKEEYVRLYEKYVAPYEQAKGDFSSDDEDSPIVPIENKITMDPSLVVDGLDISTLGDDELFSRLEGLGATVGPIVGSTRKVYQRKLAVLMGGDIVDSPTYNGDVDEEEYSDSEEAEEVVEQVVTETRSLPVKSPPLPERAEVRQRILLSSEAENPGVYDADLHTPSPRRSLRSVTSTNSTTTYESTVYRNSVNNGRSGINTSTEFTTEEEEEQDRKSKISLIVRLLVKLLFLGLIIALIIYIYQNNPDESPFKAVEHYARQALEAATGENGEEAEPSAPTATPPATPAPKAVPAQ